MDRPKLFEVLTSLDFPKGQWAVFGGACLTAYGIRPTEDLEIFVTSLLYDQLRQKGWEERSAGSTGAPYVTHVVSDIPVLAFVNCGSDRWRPDPEAYIADPEIIAGYPFMPLGQMQEWKAATARNKDLQDVRLIAQFLEASAGPQTA